MTAILSPQRRCRVLETQRTSLPVVDVGSACSRLQIVGVKQYPHQEKEAKGQLPNKAQLCRSEKYLIGEKRMSGCSVPGGEKEWLKLSGMGLCNTGSVLLTLRVRESPFDHASQKDRGSQALPTAPSQAPHC